MVIKKPEKRPFAPWLREHKALVGGGKKISGNQDLLLTPLIDMFVILVVFLIMNFSASGELITMSKDIELPKAQTTTELQRAPVIQISANAIVVEGVPVAESREVLENPDMRITRLTDELQKHRKLEERNHPGVPFKGQVVINADKGVDFKLIRKVMFAAADAGYINFNYAVLVVGGGGEAGEG